MGIETLFGYRAMKDFARYMSSQNMATQAIVVKGSADNVAFASTGTAQCIVDGAFVASLTAITTLDLSDAAVALPILPPLARRVDGPQPLAGKVVADNGRFYLLITTKAAGGDSASYCRWAHDSLTAEDAAAATLRVPYYGPDELTIALVAYSNDALTAAYTVGASLLDHDADATIYQLIGPSLLPHVENMDLN